MKYSWLDLALWTAAVLLLIPLVLHTARSVRLAWEGIP